MPVKRPPVPEPPPLETLEDGFTVVYATVRGVKYKVQELTALDYERCVEQAKNDKGEIDDIVLMKLMLGKALKEPEGLSVADLMARSYTTVQVLNRVLQDIHFRYVESEEEEAYRKAKEAQAEAERAAKEEEEGEAKAA